MADIVKPDHPRWEEFMEKLGGPDGCDFINCEGDLKSSENILEQMGCINVPATLQHFLNHGANCDCKVFLDLAS